MPLPTSVEALFLAEVGLTAIVVCVALLATFRGRASVIAISCLALWIGYAGSFCYFGLLRDPDLRPPGMLLLVGPIFVALVLLIGRSSGGLRLATSLPLTFLIGFQVFRVGVEWTIHQLYAAGLTPRLMTLEGGNVELIVAMTAPLVAWISTSWRSTWGIGGRRLALGWNIVGLLSLLNVAVRAVLSSPGPLNLIHTEVPNIGFGLFPFGLIPGFMAPLALATHILTFRAVRAAIRDAGPTMAGPKMSTVT